MLATHFKTAAESFHVLKKKKHILFTKINCFDKYTSTETYIEILWSIKTDSPGCRSRWRIKQASVSVDTKHLHGLIN